MVLVRLPSQKDFYTMNGLLFRLTDGIVAKMYTDEIPAWAKIIVG